MKEWLINQLKTFPTIQQLSNNEAIINASSDIEKALTLAISYASNPRSMLVVARNAYSAEKIFNRLVGFIPNDKVDLFVEEESLRVESISTSPESSAYRVEVLNRCINDDQRIVVTHVFALSKVYPLVDDFKHARIELTVDKVYRMEDLLQRLADIGYSRVAHIYQPLTYAKRGSVVDIYPIDHDPIRVEYFDDQIETIRYVDIESQRSSGSINSIVLSVASEYYFNPSQINEIEQRVTTLLEDKTDPTLIANIQDDLQAIKSHQFSSKYYPYVAYVSKKGSLLDYLPNAQIIFDPMNQVNDSLKYYQSEATIYLQELVENNRLLPRFSIFHPTQSFQSLKHSEFSMFANENSMVHEVDLAIKNLQENLCIINNDTHYKHKVIALNDADMELVVNKCVQLNIDYHLITDEDDVNEGINILLDSFYEGFAIDSLSLVVYTPNELIHRKNAIARFANKYKHAEVLNKIQDLKVNDYIVHNQYGIGQYIGIVTKTIQGLKKDYLHILYADNGELFVPLEQFHLVRRFVGSEGVAPKLNKLGSDRWQKTKAKLREDLADLAERLVALYSDRKKEIGYAFPSDGLEQKEFESEFEYPLTHDQQQAVDEIKADMEKPYPMDRLLCGDVGFGKTEVAIRCAFKAVMAGKQVALLCPTTLLSRQHYITFKNRFSNYPVSIQLLNRFISSSGTKETIKEINNGACDIVIGTHRILSGDIKFKDLGLLIIDEEHRFGVEQKEKIAELKRNVDVLSLSATPIPRTMQMSLMGVRPCSQLMTPPNNRYPVATYVVEHDETMIKEVIERELARDGQVFYLFNNTVDIYPYAKRLQRLLPKSKIAIVHGKMDKEEIEESMDQFMQHNADILLCTTVIENGIDIPNANTIIVDNAHTLGLAQLYQIKGRVGRSNRMGYAYLMIPKQKQLTEVATKRLNAIKEFANLGDGYQIAMRDLMIRGAGDLLGAKQSGFINTVGIDMVIDVLKEEIQVRQQKGNTVKEVTKKQVLPLNATIPNSFTNNSIDKLDLVTHIEACESKDDLLAYQSSIKDQYGKFPKEIEELFLKRRFELACAANKMEKITISNTLTLTFNSAFTSIVDGELLFDTVYRLDNNAKIAFRMEKVNVQFSQTMLMNLKHAVQLLENSESLLKKVR